MGKQRAPGSAGLVVAGLVLVSMMLAGVVARNFGEAPPEYDLLAGFTEPDRGANRVENAWPLYQKAFFELIDGPAVPCFHAWPGEPGWERTKEWLDANRALIPVLVEAVGRKQYGRPSDPVRLAESWVDFHRREGNAQELLAATEELLLQRERVHGVWDRSFVSLIKTRALAHLLAAAAREAAAAGDLDRAVSHLITTADMGRQLIKHDFLIESLIGVAHYCLASEQARRMIREQAGRLQEAQLERLAGSTLCVYQFPEIRSVLEGEWRMQQLMINRSFSEDGVGDGTVLINQAFEMMYPDGQVDYWQECLEKASLLLHAGKRETVGRIESLRETALAAADDPAKQADLERLRDELGEYRHALVRTFDPELLVENVRSTFRTSLAGRDAVAAQVAMLRYRLAEGVWPSSANALVPRFLPALPEDVEPGTTLRFEPSQGDQPPVWKSATLKL